jgi:hypothetical protein
MFWEGHILSTVGNALRAGPLVAMKWPIHCTMDEANPSKTMKISLELGLVYLYNDI